MWKFKSWKIGKGKDKWLFLLTVGVIFCILAFPADRLGEGRMEEERSAIAGEKAAGEKEEDHIPSLEVTAQVSDSYEAELERRVREILKNVEGVGAVDVMILLKSSPEKVVHVDGSTSHSLTEEQDSSGGSRRTQTQEQEQNTVLISENGGSTPIIAKEMRPEISGIIISAEGGGSPAIQAEISSAMEALFGLPAHKIKVLKRVE